jgi:multiple sugar transport system permease protein
MRARRRALVVACFLAPSLLIFFVYRILPLIWNVVLSFEYWSPLKPATWAGFDNYDEMLRDDDVFWQALWNTVIFLASQPIAIALALGIALLVNSDLKGASVYRTIVFLSYPLMTVAVAIIWHWMYNERGGLINYVLRQLGIIDHPIAFLDSFAWALPSTIVANTWQVLGFFMIVLLSGCRTFRPICMRRRVSMARPRGHGSSASPCQCCVRPCSCAWSSGC